MALSSVYNFTREPRLNNSSCTFHYSFEYVGAVEHLESHKLNSRGGEIEQSESQRLYIDTVFGCGTLQDAFTHAEGMAMLESNRSAT